MKSFYFTVTFFIASTVVAHEPSVPTEKELSRKIDYLCRKFSHLEELVCLYENIAQDIALLVHTKHEIEHEVIQQWMVENDLIRVDKRNYKKVLESKMPKIVRSAFKRLLIPQFAYLRTYIKLQNQLILNDLQ